MSAVWHPALVSEADPFWPEPGGMWIVYLLGVVIASEMAVIAYALFWRFA